MTRHGWNGTSEYYSWAMMKQRCLNPRAKNFSHYGARGITVCERWLRFENFLADMGPKPAPGYTIERNDNAGNYEPGNCRWATRAEQMRNTRRSVPIELNGVVMPLCTWARWFGRSPSGVRKRYAKGTRGFALFR